MSPPNLRALQQWLESAANADGDLKAMRKENTTLKKALAKIAAIAAKAASLDPAKRKGGRRPKIAAGSLQDRLVKAAAEPQTFPQLVEAGNARKPDVKSAVKELEQAGRLTRVGAGRWTKYQAVA